MKKTLLFISSLWGFCVLGVSACGANERYKHAVDMDNPAVTEVVTIETGNLTGVYSADGKVKVYAGIPYAAPPVGDLRWKAPQPAAKWEGIRKADHFSAIAMQGRLPLVAAKALAKAVGTVEPEYYEPMSEDCLYLNIWAPAEEGNFPVLIYIHGGALRTGSGSEAMYNGEEAARNGVVMVTINYRLGPFGYLALPELSEESGRGSGNYGLLDQIAALKWVQRNIASFGGDPSKVTIAGESAGSQSVSVLCASPLAKGLFRGAIGESATFVAPKLASPLFTQQHSEEVGLQFMAACGKKSLDELRTMKAEDIIKHELSEVSITVDGYSLPDFAWDIYSEGRQNDVALLAGYNSEEGMLFTIGQNPTPEEDAKALSETFGSRSDAVKTLFPGTSREEAARSLQLVTGAYAIGWPTWKWAEISNETGSKPAYLYYYTHVTDSGMQPFHGMEMAFAYYNPDSQTIWGENDRAFSRIMFNYWMNFVKYLDPNGPGLPEWNTYQEDPSRIMELGDAHMGMTTDPNQAFYTILDDADYQ